MAKGKRHFRLYVDKSPNLSRKSAVRLNGAAETCGPTQGSTGTSKEEIMRVRRIQDSLGNRVSYELIDDSDEPISEVSGFLRHLEARGYSPNTLSAYAYDLLHFTRFLSEQKLIYQDFTPARSLKYLEYLRRVSSRGKSRNLGPVLAVEAGVQVRRLSATTINRALAAVSSFYEYLILSDQWTGENPLQQQFDREAARVSDRHRPFIGSTPRQQPVRRVIRVRTIQRLPRPMSTEQITELLGSLRLWRDKAAILLMLHGGLRPGEVLNLHLEDIQYGRRRIVIRYRTDHPRGARTKSRTERVVDLHEPETLQTVSTYVMQERPQSADTTHIFLVGGRGQNRNQPLGYPALVKMFGRQCEKLNMRSPWVTPHALRHTHATRMWEGGMRELTLQKRLGHASPESTRIYTRVSDATVVAEYGRALGQQEET
jgi:integrase